MLQSHGKKMSFRLHLFYLKQLVLYYQLLEHERRRKTQKKIKLLLEHIAGSLGSLLVSFTIVL